MRGPRVATLNIWGRQGPWEQRREVIREQLAALDVDFIGLQEVLRYDAAPDAPRDAGSIETGDQSMELAKGLDLPGLAYGGAMELGFGYSFGNAILSRYPLHAVDNLALPSVPGAMPRALLSALARTPYGDILFCTTHLSWRFDEGALRMRQAMIISSTIERRRSEASFPAILVGDFNAEPDSDEIRFLRGLATRGGVSTCFIDAFAEVGSGEGATFCAANDFARELNEPDRRIDYVFVHGRETSGLGRPRSCTRAFDERRAPALGATPLFGSDHFGVIAELTPPAGPRSVANPANREANA